MKKREGLLELGRISKRDLDLNEEAIRAGATYNLKSPQVITWFLPLVTHALKGGVRTVFTFAERLTKRHGTLSVFVLYSYNGREFDTEELARSLRRNFPELNFLLRTFIRGKDRIDDLPASEAGFCTLWTTAYLLLRYNQVHKKFYFMQDYEPMFYEGGGVYMLIEETYRFGFSCIANTPGVGERYKVYSNDVTTFLPGVDRTIFYPSSNRKTPGAPFKVVFYGRPENSRNAFHLGVEVIRDLKAELKERVHIISVGAEWAPRDYDLEGVVDNWGLLQTIEDVAECYRSADMGLVFMATPHPSYQPLEYMASGCVVATNINEGTGWLINSENALVLEPNPGIAAERIIETLETPDRMLELRAKGLETVNQLNWDDAYEVFETRLTESSCEWASVPPGAPVLEDSSRNT